MKLKDLISVVQCNTYIELFSRDAKLINIFMRRDLENIESELSPYLESNIFMISADSNVLQVCII